MPFFPEISNRQNDVDVKYGMVKDRIKEIITLFKECAKEIPMREVSRLLMEKKPITIFNPDLMSWFPFYNENGDIIIFNDWKATGSIPIIKHSDMTKFVFVIKGKLIVTKSNEIFIIQQPEHPEIDIRNKGCWIKIKADEAHMFQAAEDTQFITRLIRSDLDIQSVSGLPTDSIKM